MEVLASLGFIFVTLGISAIIVGFLTMTIKHEYPKNIFAWRAERRRNIEIAREQRISALEHDLGYLPCSRENCRTCKKALSAQPKQQISSMTGLVTDLYDRMVDLALHSPPPPTADPAKILK